MVSGRSLPTTPPTQCFKPRTLSLSQGIWLLPSKYLEHEFIDMLLQPLKYARVPMIMKLRA